MYNRTTGLTQLLFRRFDDILVLGSCHPGHSVVTVGSEMVEHVSEVSFAAAMEGRKIQLSKCQSQGRLRSIRSIEAVDKH